MGYAEQYGMLPESKNGLIAAYAERYGILKHDNKSGWYSNTEPVRKMTKREAVEILEEISLLDDSIYQYNPRYMDALDLVIELLRQEGEIE